MTCIRQALQSSFKTSLVPIKTKLRLKHPKLLKATTKKLTDCLKLKQIQCRNRVPNLRSHKKRKFSKFMALGLAVIAKRGHQTD